MIRNITRFMRAGTLFIMLLMSAIAGSAEAAGKGNDAALKVNVLVESNQSDVDWREDSIIAADFNCDGIEDYAIKGSSSKRVNVGIILGPLSDGPIVHVLSFKTDDNVQQDALCEDDPSIDAENLDYAPSEMLGGYIPEGFERSDNCMGLKIGGELCDAIHIYWNHKDSRPGWWRL